MMTNEAERKVFDMVEKGQISAEEALRLINAMQGLKADISDQVDYTPADLVQEQVISSEDEQAPEPPHIPEESLKRMNQLKRWWVLPFGIGLLMTILGAIWMYMGYTASGFGIGFWLAWIPFLLGIFVISVSFQASHGVWLHVRIKQKPGETPQRIAISLPIPISLTRWVISTFGSRIPGMKDGPVDSYSDVLKSVTPEEPFYIHVDEGDGEEVEVFIG
jgi:hypothetical protein